MKRAELFELMKKARKQLKKYHVPRNEQTITLSIDTLENVLSEQSQIVQCKDCKHYDEETGAFGERKNLCKNCKTEIRPGDKYCHECGSKISSL